MSSFGNYGLGFIPVVYIDIGMTNLDVNVPLQIFLETNGLNSTDDLDHHNIAMGGVSYGYDVYGCLTGAMCF